MLSNIIKHEDYVNPTYSFCEFFGKYLKYLVIKELNKIIDINLKKEYNGFRKMNLEENFMFESVCCYITTACNTTCDYCFRLDSEKKYMDIETFKKVLNKLKELGCKRLAITGGEPTLHPNIKEMINIFVKNSHKIASSISTSEISKSSFKSKYNMENEKNH